MNFKLFETQLNGILDDFSDMMKRSKTLHKDLSDLPYNELQGLVTRGVAAIERITGKHSAYTHEATRILGQFPRLPMHVPMIMGVVQALRDDVRAEYLTSVVSLAHGEIFADFLEMADHLQLFGYKDAAAVIAGSALEAQLRALCVKNGLSVNETKSDGTLKLSQK